MQQLDSILATSQTENKTLAHTPRPLDSGIQWEQAKQQRFCTVMHCKKLNVLLGWGNSSKPYIVSTEPPQSHGLTMLLSVWINRTGATIVVECLDLKEPAVR